MEKGRQAEVARRRFVTWNWPAKFALFAKITGRGYFADWTKRLRRGMGGAV